MMRNNLSGDRVERLDNFLHGIAHSGNLSKKTRLLSISPDLGTWKVSLRCNAAVDVAFL
jgi:hypothetical protein